MRDEDLLKETFHDALRAEPEARDDWARFQRARERMLRVRLAGVLGVAAVAMLLLVMAFPVLNSGRETRLPQQLEPKRFAAGKYEDPVVGFELIYPTAWAARGEAGETAEFFPLLEGTPEGAVLSDQPFAGAGFCGGCFTSPTFERPQQFFVQVRPFDISCPEPTREGAKITVIECGHPFFDPPEVVAEQRAVGASAALARVELDRAKASQIDLRFPQRPRLFPNTAEERAKGHYNPPYWCAGCTVREYLIFAWSADWAIRVRVVAPDAEAATRYMPLAEQLVTSLDHIPVASPSPA